MREWMHAQDAFSLYYQWSAIKLLEFKKGFPHLTLLKSLAVTALVSGIPIKGDSKWTHGLTHLFSTCIATARPLLGIFQDWVNIWEEAITETRLQAIKVQPKRTKVQKNLLIQTDKKWRPFHYNSQDITSFLFCRKRNKKRSFGSDEFFQGVEWCDDGSVNERAPCFFFHSPFLLAL